MSTIKTLDREDYRLLFRLSRRFDPYPEHNFYDEFCDNLDTQRGFTIWNNGELVGLVSYTNFVPGVTVVIQFLQDFDRKGVVTKETVKEAFRFPFIDLDVPVLSSYSVPGVTDKAGDFLLRLGFTLEGRRRGILAYPDGQKDELIYGMLRSECRWL